VGTLERWQVTTHSATATRRLARNLGRRLAPGTVLALTGELGAGKTTFVQGLAEGLGVFDLRQVLSPTYTLVNEHPGARATLVHVDFYRLESEAAGRALGLEEPMGQGGTVVTVEWAERFSGLLPASAVWVRLALGRGSVRRIEVEGLARPRTARRRALRPARRRA
jgi:tRNA threonylcarbamoyladenosine biosynthesis protein TsaE